MNIQQCRYILKIVEYGSFNEAARQMFIAQSSLSVGVKALEKELGIKIFERSGNGVYLTEDGTEFVHYARQIVEQNDFVLKSYTSNIKRKRLYVATQHYDLVTETFAKLLSETEEQNYRFSLKEMRTYDVIKETENAKSDIGIIGIRGSDCSIMERFLSKNGLEFTSLLKVKPHVYLNKNHTLAKKEIIKPEELKQYPSITYEQGEHSATFFAEEVADAESEKQVTISDRATLMSMLLNTDCYTIGTGIMPSRLNEGRIVSIPYEIEETYTVGYLLRTDRNLSQLTKRFIDMLISEIENLK